MSNTIAGHYQIVPDGKAVLLMKAPLYLVGTRTAPVDESGKPDPTMGATSRRMLKALDDGEITQAQAADQAKLIQQYQRIFQTQAAAKAAKVAP
jgi:hypothetical protein